MQDLFNNHKTFMMDLLDGEKKDCPCCGRYAQVYRRHLHHDPAKKLIKLYRAGGAEKFIHTSVLIEKGDTSVGDFSKAKHWKLIHQADPDSDAKKTSGMWKLTQKGISFVRGEISIQRIALIFDDRVLGFSDDMVTIQECLDGGGFNYRELMEAA